MAIKAVFFDMDGVLYDSMPIHAKSWVATFAAEGISFEPKDAYINEGRTGSSTINTVYNRLFGHDATDEDVKRIYGRKTQIVDTFPPAPKMKGMAELITWLRNNNIQTFVVTGSRQPSLVNKLGHDFGFDVDHIISGADVKRGKPDPEPYLIAVDRAKVSAADCVVVENAPLGIRASKAAGIFTVAVNTGDLEDSYLLNEGADILLGSTEELSEAWRNGELKIES